LFVFALASLLQLLFGESKMNKLSQSAQAVLDAYVDEDRAGRLAVAAALRAAADQAQASVYHTTPSTDWGKGWKEGMRDAVKDLYAIAAELDGATTTSENV
jgi:DNA primase